MDGAVTATRPDLYRVRVVTPDGEAELRIEHGFCTEAPDAFSWCVGKSAAWLSGHFIFRGWRAFLRLEQPEPIA